MVKLVFCLHRRDGMTRAEFQRYWRERHAPLVARHAETLGIRRYVQTHTVDTPLNDALRGSRGGPEGYDGVAELWWDDLDALANTSAEAAAAAAELLEDERRFIDLGRSPLWLAHEHEVVAP